MNFRLMFPPNDHMLFTLHRDMPGIIGKIGFIARQLQREYCQYAGGVVRLLEEKQLWCLV